MKKRPWQKNLSIGLAALLLGAVAGIRANQVLDRSDAAEVSKPPVVRVVADEAPLTRDTRLTTSFAPVVKKAAPSVVNIFTTKTVRRPALPELHPFLDDPFFRRFFGDRFRDAPQRPRSFTQRSLGSGVIVSEDGYILTNNHVVEGADEIKVAREKDRTEYTAKVVGRDPKTDVAVLKIEATGLPVATFGDSDALQVGDVVLAIGNPFGVGQTVTLGIISALSRGGMGIEEYEDFIQTDAAINPGNSGGALVDAAGRVVGINTAIVSRTGGSMGVGFAVPINLARSVLDQLIAKGKVVRGFLGVSIQDLTPALAKEFKVPETGGALVGGIAPKGAAAQAGLKTGDVIIEFNGKPVPDSRTLRIMVGHTAPGTKVDLKVLREGKERAFKVTLQEMTERDIAGVETPAAPDEVLKGVTVGDIDAAARRKLNLPEDLKGALILEVDPESASYEAGLRPGEVILEINRQSISTAEEAVQATQKVGNRRTLVRVWSGGLSRFVVVDESQESRQR